MANYHFKCQDCTNKYVGFCGGKPATWCKPTVDGLKLIWWAWGTGKTENDHCYCKYYSTDAKQAELRII